MANQIIRPDTVHPTTGYSLAVRAGNTLYISGQVAQDRAGNVVGKGDIAAQAAQVFANLKAVVEAAGGTLQDIVKLNTYTTSLAYRPAIAEARGKYWQSDWPASTFVVISSLATPDYLVEIEAVAVLGG
jgi:2-iminobutanoate/2-iminopropanoate deaminase